MQCRNFFVQLLWQHMHANRILIWFCPEFDLRENLICKRIAHNKAWVSCRTTQVYQTTLREKNNMSKKINKYNTIHKSRNNSFEILQSRTHTHLPFSKRYLSTCGFIFVFSTAFFSSHATSISQSKCPMLQTIASFGMQAKWRATMMPLQPVVVTYICPFVDASSIVVTWKLGLLINLDEISNSFNYVWKTIEINFNFTLFNITTIKKL